MAANAAAFLSETAADPLQTRPEEELLWTSKIRILRGAFWRTNGVLQVLIAHMAEAEPKFLDQLQQVFTKHHTLGAGEQDYTGRPHTQSTLSSRWCA